MYLFLGSFRGTVSEKIMEYNKFMSYIDCVCPKEVESIEKGSDMERYLCYSTLTGVQRYVYKLKWESISKLGIIYDYNANLMVSDFEGLSEILWYYMKELGLQENPLDSFVPEGVSIINANKEKEELLGFNLHRFLVKDLSDISGRGLYYSLQDIYLKGLMEGYYPFVYYNKSINKYIVSEDIASGLKISAILHRFGPTLKKEA